LLGTKDNCSRIISLSYRGERDIELAIGELGAANLYCAG
jgi:hypothetical protein